MRCGSIGGKVEEWIWSYLRGNNERVEDYTGITLMATLYKIYIGVLAERLKEEVKEKRITPGNQTGFRKEMGTLDNIYV